MKTLLSTIAALAILTSGAAMADTATTTAKPAPAAKVAAQKPAQKVARVQTEKSKKCSADADAKNLHGKERKAFRASCMKSA